MTLPIERARSRRPVTWLTMIGVLLLPALIGGILVAALYNPTERLESMTAAIVNDDDPVTIDGQYTPLGRQLAAGLVDGSDEVEGNLTWVLSNDEDAEAGLADGSYQAVVTIPANFSAAATSAGQALSGGSDDPQQATITVTTPPDALIVDDAIAAQVAQAAASATGQSISTLTLENVFLGFTTLGEQLGEAADGASQLADGAGQTADGATQAADGATELADGTSQLADGAGALAQGTQQLADGAAALPSGARQLADGTNGIASGADALAGGLGELTRGTQQISDGAETFAQELESGAAQIANDGIVPDQLQQAADGTSALAAALAEWTGTAADATAGTAASAGALAGELAGLSADCSASASEEFCARLEAASDNATTTAAAAGDAAVAAGTANAIATGDGSAAQPGIVAAAGGTAEGLRQFDQQGSAEFAAQFREIAANIRTLGAGAAQVAGGLEQSTSGAAELAGGAQQLGAGASALADGTEQLASGTNDLADGASTLASGTSDLAGGATSLADGVTQLADGTTQLADGTSSLADGLDEAVAALPSFSDSQAQSLAEVVAAPVTSEGVGSNIFGASAVPLLATLALWFGAVASYIAMQAATRRALTSHRPSISLALRTFLPGAALGAAQGLLVAIVVQFAASYAWDAWFAFAGLAILAGVAFAAVNQALVAVLGGAGRWVAALIGVLAIATGIVSTVPGGLAWVAGLMPTAPAYQALLSALTAAGGMGAAVTGLLVWTVLALVATTIAVATRRSLSARALAVEPAPAL